MKLKIIIVSLILSGVSIIQSAIAQEVQGGCSEFVISVTGQLDAFTHIVETTNDPVGKGEKDFFYADWPLADLFTTKEELRLKFFRISDSRWKVIITSRSSMEGQKAKEYGSVEISFSPNGQQEAFTELGFRLGEIDPVLGNNRVYVKIENFSLKQSSNFAKFSILSEANSICGGFGEIVDPKLVNQGLDVSVKYYSSEEGTARMLRDR